MTGFKIANVPFNKREILTLACLNGLPNLIKVALITGGKIIKPDNYLVQFKKRFQKIRSDKPGYASDKPSSGDMRRSCFTFSYVEVIPSP